MKTLPYFNGICFYTFMKFCTEIINELEENNFLGKFVVLIFK